MKQLKFSIIVESDQEGYFVSCPSLQGCYSQGDTYEEAIENIRDAIRRHAEDRLANGEKVLEGYSFDLSITRIPSGIQVFDLPKGSPLVSIEIVRELDAEQND